MSREVASTTETSLGSELLQAGYYKPNQGRIVRQVTCLTIWIVIALGVWRLYVTLRGALPMGWELMELTIPAVVGLAGAWFGFRVVNWPRFADFLIAVEAEMNKVSWPSRTELVRASIVVIVTIFFLAMVLFLFDIVWQFFFRTLGVSA